MSDASTDLATIVPSNDDTIGKSINALRNGGAGQIYTSLTGDDFDTRLTIIDAVSSSEPIADHLGEEMPVKDVIVQSVDMTDEQTGEVRTQPRVIFLLDDGTARHAISPIVLRSLVTFIGVLGQPSTWAKPIDFVVTQKNSGKYKFYDLGLYKAPKK